jgi:cell division GTPase FtsZ
MYISSIGLGQAGSNISDEFAKRGFYSAAINFSIQDLNSLEHIDDTLKLKLVGSEGIGKQRSNAITLMNNNWDLSVNFVKENFSHPSIEIIFVPFSTGGGSGSGMAPILLELLTESMPEKAFVALPIMPSKDESFIAQKNCLEAFEDLSKLDICILPIDNDKALSTLSNYGKNSLYMKVNEFVVSIVERLISYTDKHSKYGVFDKNDLKNIFKSNGLCTISETKLMNLSNKFDLSEEGIARNIKDSWKTSLFADVEFNQILSAGIIFDGQENLMEILNTKGIFSDFGNKMPISLFEGYYNSDKGGKVITILSGLSWCNTRLQEIDQIAIQTNEVFQNINQSPAYKSKLSELSLPSSMKTKEVKKVNDISSIINKFKR